MLNTLKVVLDQLQKDLTRLRQYKGVGEVDELQDDDDKNLCRKTEERHRGHLSAYCQY